MTYRIRPHRASERPFSKLELAMRKRVVEKLELVAGHPEMIDPPMRNLPQDLRGLHKIRVGDWRIFFWVDHERKEIIPYDVDRRDKAYQGLRD